jgi:hypothetical protein
MSRIPCILEDKKDGRRKSAGVFGFWMDGGKGAAGGSLFQPAADKRQNLQPPLLKTPYMQGKGGVRGACPLPPLPPYSPSPVCSLTPLSRAAARPPSEEKKQRAPAPLGLQAQTKRLLQSKTGGCATG